jgi:methylmalonyl-CoA carboxyltransferase small subunit
VATICACAGEGEKALKLRIKIEGKTYEAEVEILDAQESAPEYPPYPSVQSTFVPATLAETSSSFQSETGDNEKECRSPVTGMVIKVNVEAGQIVEANAVIIVLESMKMEMQITAPVGGLVKSVLVAPGTAVKVNQLMVDFE